MGSTTARHDRIDADLYSVVPALANQGGHRDNNGCSAAHSHGGRDGHDDDAAEYAYSKFSAAQAREPGHPVNLGNSAGGHFLCYRRIDRLFNFKYNEAYDGTGDSRRCHGEFYIGLWRYFFLTACIAVAGLLLSILLRKPKNKSEDELSENESMPDAKAMISH